MADIRATVVLRVSAALACVLLAVAGAGRSVPYEEESAPEVRVQQDRASLRFYTRGFGAPSTTAANAATSWGVYDDEATVFVVLEGALPDTGNLLRLDEGVGWRREMHGLPLTPADTAGRWVTHRRYAIGPLSALPRIGAGRRLLGVAPERMARLYARGSDEWVTRLRAVLRTSAGDSLVAEIRTGFAL